MELPSDPSNSATALTDPFRELSFMESGIVMCIREDGDVSSGPVSSKAPGIAFAAGVLLELTLRGLVQQEGKDKYKLLSDQKTGDSVVDDAIDITMKETKGEAVSIEEWLKNINGTLIFRHGIPMLRERIYDRLVQKKVLVKVESKTLGIASVKYPFAATDGVKNFDAALRKAALEIDEKMDERTLCVLGLFEALDKPFRSKVGNALDINRIFADKAEREKARANLDKLFSEDVGTEANAKSIANAVAASVVRRMISIAVLGMFHILRNL